MTFPLVTMLHKGPLHLEQRINGFILPGLWHSFLPLLLSLVTTKLVRVFIHSNFFATDNECLKWNDPCNRKLNKCFALLFKSRCRGTKLQNKFASSLKVLPEPVPARKLLHRGTAFFALRSCHARVCSWTRVPPYLCRWFWKVGVCRRTSGWHALLLKHLLPATGQIMGFTLETGIFGLVPDRTIPVGYCFDCCCFIFDASPPGYQMGDDESEEAADRRRGLLKQICSQERAVGIFANSYPWSNSTSVRKPILRNWMSLSFLSSKSACYWDPEVAFRRYGSYFPLCNTLSGGEYTAFFGIKGVFIMSRSPP